jgi:hypothetical protein
LVDADEPPQPPSQLLLLPAPPAPSRVGCPSDATDCVSNESKSADTAPRVSTEYCVSRLRLALLNHELFFLPALPSTDAPLRRPILTPVR